MATTSGRANSSLAERLSNFPYRFDFFQAVRLLERVFPGRQPVGFDVLPENEVVRFRSHISPSFPASQIYDLSNFENLATKTPELTVTFMGLAGVQGVLPEHYTEHILERVREGDSSLRDFLDLFNHRLIAFFYRAWEKYRFPIALERAASRNEEFDPVSLDILSLLGMSSPSLRERTEIEGKTLLFFSGLLAQQPRSAVALTAVIGHYFHVSVSIKQFLGDWLDIPPDQRSCLTSRNPLRLAKGPVLGARCWDQQASFRLTVGPLSFDDFQKFLPSDDFFLKLYTEQKGLKKLVHFARFFVGQALDFDVQLVLKAAEVPTCRISSDRGIPVRLGFTSWLNSNQEGGLPYDANDLVVGYHWTRL